MELWLEPNIHVLELEYLLILDGAMAIVLLDVMEAAEAAEAVRYTNSNLIKILKYK